MRSRLIFLGLAVSGVVQPVAGQEWTRVTSHRAEYRRVLEVAGETTRPLAFYAPSTDTARPGLSILPVEAHLVLNSRNPWGFNDEALWAGKGLSGIGDLGIRFRAGVLTLTVAPSIWFARNASFDTVTGPGSLDPLAYPWSTRIDYPQRMGTKPLFRLTPGQSGIRLNWHAMTLGFSTENMWWGPASRYPILMGASAEGFPHVDLGLRPTSTPVGAIEARAVWGRLTESAWFDSIPSNDHRLLAGLLLAWQPRWLPGLTLGAQRVFYQTWTDSLKTSDFLAVIQPFTKDLLADSTNPLGNDARDQMLSLTWRWVFPSVGFEVYGEWARNDHSWNLRDIIEQPDHAQGTLMGLQYTRPSGTGRMRLQAEMVHLDRGPTAQIRGEPTFYEHHLVRQGYTNKGQLLGAGIGPGSNAQYLAFDRWSGERHWGIWLERVRWFTDDFYKVIGNSYGSLGPMDVTLELGARYDRGLGALRLFEQASLVRELDRHFMPRNDVWNINVQSGVRWDF